MRIDRPGLRRLNEPEGPGRRRIGQPPGPPRRSSDQSGLYIGLGVGGVILVIAIAVAMSSGGGEKPQAKKSVDPEIRAEIETATSLFNSGNLVGARDAFDRIVSNPAYAESKLVDHARKSAADIRQRISFFEEAEAAIKAFEDKVEASKKAQTAMAQADAFWAESGELTKKYGGTPTINKVHNIRTDLERWRGTSDAGAWEKSFFPTQERIQRDCLSREDFSAAVKEWRQFAEGYGHPELKSKVESQIVIINKAAADAAKKLVESVGTGAAAKAKLEEAQTRFMNTDGQKIINQKLSSLN